MLYLFPEFVTGGFESGEVKVWLISHQSLITLRKPSNDASNGMSVPALQLLSEWAAHDSCILKSTCCLCMMQGTLTVVSRSVCD